MIKIKNVGIKFNLSEERIDTVKEYIVKLFKGELFYKEFEALKDITFEVSEGEILGIIGNNGAGKSTLLKILAGVLNPSEGEVRIDGKVAPLIEVGAGFDIELTARENIYLNGAMLGYSKKEIEENFDSIVEFAEINKFIDIPLKNFSSGMYARLGFSIATAVKPDILIVDEVLAVGDLKFQNKCEKKIREMISENITVIFVSHDIHQIENICSKVIWLENGKIKKIGNSKEICFEYKKQINI